MAEVKKVGEIYKCELCGNLVEVKEVGGGELICCGEPMELLNDIALFGRALSSYEIREIIKKGLLSTGVEIQKDKLATTLKKDQLI